MAPGSRGVRSASHQQQQLAFAPQKAPPSARPTPAPASGPAAPPSCPPPGAAGVTELLPDLRRKFDELMATDTLPHACAMAMKHVLENPPNDHLLPVGKACVQRPFQDVLSLAKDGGSVLFSGTLWSLALDEPAIGTTMDLGRCSYLVETLRTCQVGLMLNPIIVNVDGASPAAAEGLKRAHRDAEVMVAMLVAHWHVSEAGVYEALQQTFRDLVLDGRALGSGTTFECHKLKLIDREEDSRAVLGMSAFRKCLFLVDLHEQAMKELRCTSAKSDADTLLNIFRAEGVATKGWNMDTLRRYLTVGRRVNTNSIRAFITRWESLERRDCLIDGITVLRAVVQTAPNEADLEYILHTLFFEQRAGLRSARDFGNAGTQGRSPNAKMKAILLRRSLLIHLAHTFPAFAVEVDSYLGPAFYFKMGINQLGVRDAAAPVEDAGIDEDAREEPSFEALTAPTGEVTTFRSRTPLLTFCEQLMRGRYERTLIGMVRDATDPCVLDLACAAAASIYKVVQLIAKDYELDFPKAPAAAPKTVLAMSPAARGAATLSVEVHLSSEVLDDQDYQARLGKWNVQVTEHEAQQVMNYIGARIQFIVDPMDSLDAIRKKAQRVTLLQESCRKLYLYDDRVSRPVDWGSIRKRKRSVFHPTVPIFEESSLDPFLEVYATTRTVDASGTSEDIVMVFLHGNPPNVLGSRHLEACVRKLRSLVPRHVQPKIGTVVTSATDILRRVKARGAWGGQNESFLAFTWQKRQAMPRKTMRHLVGDTYINKWPVGGIPFAQVAKVDMSLHDKLHERLLHDPLAFHEEEDGDGQTVEMQVDEEAALGTQVVPYPHEHATALTQELLHVFDATCLVLFHPGSGQALRAVLLENARAVAFCQNAAQKAFVLGQLTDFVRSVRLAPMGAAPPKPAELLAYEARARPRPKQEGQPGPSVAPAAAGSLPRPTVLAASSSSGAAVPPAPAPRIQPLAAFGAGAL